MKIYNASKRMARALVRCAALAALVGPVAPAASAEDGVFRIGTGGPAGTYFPIGQVVARAITDGGGGECPADADCGVPGLLGVAMSGNGSVANIDAIAAGEIESGFAQADVAFWKHSGSGRFAGSQPISSLRAIASLYPETVHLLARADAGVATPADLRGKRVSLDEPGSGTIVDARIVLEAYDLTESDIRPNYIKPHLAIPKMRAGALDAYFIVAGHPVTSVTKLAAEVDIVVAAIMGGPAERIIRRYPFFTSATIPAGVYGDHAAVPTIAVTAQWLTSSEIDPELVYQVTRALWSDHARKQLDAGHPKGREITLESALDGVGIPLHAGAERYYKEAGLL